RVARVFAEEEIAVEEGLRWGWVVGAVACVLWDVEVWQSILLRQVPSAREAGLLVPPFWDVAPLGLSAALGGPVADAGSPGAGGGGDPGRRRGPASRRTRPCFSPVSGGRKPMPPG